MRDQIARPADQVLAAFGQHRRAARAVEQHRAQFVFQRAYLHAHGRERQTDGLARFGKTAAVRNRHEGVQGFDVHALD